MSPSTVDTFIETYSRVSHANHTLLSRFITVANRFNQAGISFLLLKGADVISRLYGVRGSRPITDIDLLVHEADLPLIDDVLTRIGFVQQIDGNPSYVSSELGLSLDLVTGLWYLNEQELADVWSRSITRPFGPIAIACLATEDLLIHLTAYAVVHRGHMSAAFSQDLRLLIEKESPDWSTVRMRAQHAHMGEALHLALTHIRRCFPALPIPPEVLSQIAPGNRPLLAWFLRRVVTTAPLPQVGHLLLFVTQPSGKKLFWLYQTLFPSPVFLSYRYGSASLQRPWRTRFRRLYGLVTSGLVLIGHVIRRIVTDPRRHVA